MAESAYKNATSQGVLRGLDFPFPVGRNIIIHNLVEWYAFVDGYCALEERRDHWRNIASARESEIKLLKQRCELLEGMQKKANGLPKMGDK